LEEIKKELPEGDDNYAIGPAPVCTKGEITFNGTALFVDDFKPSQLEKLKFVPNNKATHAGILDAVVWNKTTEANNTKALNANGKGNLSETVDHSITVTWNALPGEPIDNWRTKNKEKAP
jgi:hypothetical protein